MFVEVEAVSSNDYTFLHIVGLPSRYCQAGGGVIVIEKNNAVSFTAMPHIRQNASFIVSAVFKSKACILLSFSTPCWVPV